MSELAIVSLIMGVVLTIIYGSAVLFAGKFKAVLDSFPRNFTAAWVLTAIDLLWVVYLIRGTAMGSFTFLKPVLYALAPVAFFLLLKFLDELLAPRALGGLFLLLAAPMLDAARWNSSSLRLIVTALTYLMVIKGIILVLNPYRFRHGVEIWDQNPNRYRIASYGGAILGLGLVVLSLTVY